MERDTRILQASKQAKIEQVSSPPSSSEGQDGDMRMCKTGQAGMSLYIKAFGAWQEFYPASYFEAHDVWTRLTLESGWADWHDSNTAYYPASYKVDLSGWVHLRGLVKSSGAAWNSTFAYLPAPIRPAKRTSGISISGDDSFPPAASTQHELFFSMREDGQLKFHYKGTSTSAFWHTIDNNSYYIGVLRAREYYKSKGII
jgi:hypothetical protein